MKPFFRAFFVSYLKIGMQTRILILGSNGQIGTVLSKALMDKFGLDQVICSDIRVPAEKPGQFIQLDILDTEGIKSAIDQYQINTVYHLAALLSANGEKNPELTWRINMDGTLGVFQVCVEKSIQRIFFPSSIAVYGPTTPKLSTPQHTSFEPSTVYGISKVTGELWAQYYHKRYGLDVRSIRYPGVIGWQSIPEGGTTDYAVEIYHAALRDKHYNCFLKKDTMLPMIYMDDVIKATLQLMDAPSENIHIRTSYNVAGMSFTPAQIYASIQKHLPDFTINYEPDFRQQIAESWNQSIDDSSARNDWAWKPTFDLESMTVDMLSHLKVKLSQ